MNANMGSYLLSVLDITHQDSLEYNALCQWPEVWFQDTPLGSPPTHYSFVKEVIKKLSDILELICFS